MRAIADRVLVIFPFEEAIYREAGVPVAFVGHPLVDLAAAGDRRGVPAGAWTCRPRRRRSRFCRAAARTKCTAFCPTCSAPPAAFAPAFRRRSSSSPARRISTIACSNAVGDGGRVRWSEGETDAVLASADVALTASGTATVQTALHDTPMVVVYRLSPLTYRLGRRLVKVDTFAMVNLIAGERIVPELIQDAFTPEAVAREAISMLTDHDRHAADSRAGWRGARPAGRSGRQPARRRGDPRRGEGRRVARSEVMHFHRT